MKKTIAIFAGAFALSIAAGTVFFPAQKKDPIASTIYLENMEVLAQNEPGGDDGNTTTHLCYQETIRSHSSDETYQCRGGSDTYETQWQLDEAAAKPKFKKLSCYEVVARTHDQNSRIGYCYKRN
jgi:hypothetical protein